MIYLDNASTTAVLPEAIQKAIQLMGEDFGNPSSLHDFGFRTEQHIIAAQCEIAKRFPKGRIIFTSGATESNFTAILGIANANKCKHIVTTVVEHESVLFPFKRLQSMGYDVTYISVDSQGKLNLNQLYECIRHDTALVSVMHVNNETGVINPIEQIADSIKKINKDVYIHTDAVQSFLKLELSAKNIDAVSISGHKLHAPKGIGALYIKDKTKITPLMDGSQQGGFRAGTENTAGIAALGVACRLFDSNTEHIQALKERLVNGLNNIGDVIINGGVENTSPYILNASILGTMGETIVHSLEQEGIYISHLSACSSKRNKHSHVISAMTDDKAIIESAVRFSFSHFNTFEEVDKALTVLDDATRVLRKLNTSKQPTKRR